MPRSVAPIIQRRPCSLPIVAVSSLFVLFSMLPAAFAAESNTIHTVNSTDRSNIASPSNSAPSPQARLDAIRNALADLALESPTEIHSTAFIDESGVLHENTRIRSDLKLRSLRTLPVKHWPSTEENPEKNNSKTESIAHQKQSLQPLLQFKRCASPASHLKRHASLELQVRPMDGKGGLLLMRDMGMAAEQALHQAINADGHWVITTNPNFKSTYEAALYSSGNEVAVKAPFHLRIALTLADKNSPTQVADKGRWWDIHYFKYVEHALGLSSTVPPPQVNFNLTLIETQSGKLLWEKNQIIAYPQPTLERTRTALSETTIQQIQTFISGWHKQLSQKIACEPMEFRVERDINPNTLTLLTGERIGLHVGDQLLVFDPDKIPHATLEKGVIEQIGLVEIVSIQTDQSKIKLIAGALPAHSARLTAMMP